MEGIGFLILAVICGIGMACVCVGSQRLRRFALAALLAPVAASLVFILGGFILADMNPAQEHGRNYAPTGKEHDPAGLQIGLWLASVALTFVATGIFCVKAAKHRS